LQGALALLMYQTRKVPYQFDLFTAGQSYYSCGSYQKADSVFHLYNQAYPDSIYGYYWSALTNLALDTTLSVEPYLSNMVAGFKKTLDVAGTNKTLFKSQAIRSSLYLAGIYNNTKKDKDSAIYFVNKGLEFDAANPNLQGIKTALEKKSPPTKSPSKSNSNSSGKPAALNKQEADKTKAQTGKK